MKKFLFMCMMALGCMTAFTACGDDDDDPVIEDIQGGSGSVKTSNYSLKDNGNEIVLTFDMTAAGVTMNMKWVATFQNDLCVSFVEQTTYPSESMAKLSYEAAVKEGETVRLDGRTIITDLSESYAGMDKATVKLIMETMYQSMTQPVK